jgi:GTP-binding protein HflX
LDIFAQRARTAEAKYQVELAQLNYLFPRLVGMGLLMSRLGGGIGTRGPGETELEYDRRRIRRRIYNLEKNINEVRRHRKALRASRNTFPFGSIVGYTNAGKSTLLNVLCGSNVKIEDQLFTTLDPTTRKVVLPNKTAFLLTDTVGFIRNLPHHLVSAFSATLEEVKEADFLIHVVDASSPFVKENINSVLKVLDELSASNKPTVTVFNKLDAVEDFSKLEGIIRSTPNSVAVSLLYRKNLEKLLFQLEDLEVLRQEFLEVDLALSEFSLFSWIHEIGNVFYKEYKDDRVVLQVGIPCLYAEKLKRMEKGNERKVRVSSLNKKPSESLADK